MIRPLGKMTLVLLPLFFWLTAPEATAQKDTLLKVLEPEGGVVLGHPFYVVLESEDFEGLVDPPDLGPHIRILRRMEDEPGRRRYKVFAIRSGTIALPGASLEVRTPLRPGENSLREPDLLRPAPEAGKAWMFYVMILALVAAFFLTWMRIRREKSLPGEEFRPSHEAALSALEELEGVRPETPRAMDEYYVTLSRILRRYLHERFGVEAVKKITDEVRLEIHRGGHLEEGRADALIELLDRCDRVKFALRAADPGRAKADRRSAESFVRSTAPLLEGGGEA